MNFATLRLDNTPAGVAKKAALSTMSLVRSKKAEQLQLERRVQALLFEQIKQQKVGNSLTVTEGTFCTFRVGSLPVVWRKVFD